ncbi:MAG: efflux transporter periplasmic adaptor subunit [Thalassobium sp.]|jgi:RND family efflux transporter MFP subunit|nr:MAG: efflux transporter periplasmic adaptor subunit [Oceanospirillales bacterium]PHQ88070.1 MAG: efflux transporter periplasmic adaptor subunit [Thalassobium sp.]
MQRNILFSLFVACIIGVVGYLLFSARLQLISTSSEVARNSGKPIPVEIQAVDSGIVSSSYAVTATAAVGESVSIRPQIEGIIETQSVQLGDVVEKGQELLAFDDVMYASNLEMTTVLLDSKKKLLDFFAKNMKEVESLLAGDYVSQEKYSDAFLSYNQAQTNYAEAKHNLASAEYALANTHIVTPISGVISEVKSFPSAYIKKGEEAMVISSIDPILFKILLPEKELQFFTLGKDVDIRLPAYDNETLSGNIYRIDPELDEVKGAAKVYVQAPNKSLRVKPGMTGVVYFKEDRHSARIPSIALINQLDREGTVFKVNKDGVVQLTTVRLGRTGGGYFEILDGLAVGDKIVVAGQQSLRDGDHVKVGE